MAFELPCHGSREEAAFPQDIEARDKCCWAWAKGIFLARRNSLGASGGSGLHAEGEPIDPRTIRVASLL